MKESDFVSFSQETISTALLFISGSLCAVPRDRRHVHMHVSAQPMVALRQRSDGSYQATAPYRQRQVCSF